MGVISHSIEAPRSATRFYRFYFIFYPGFFALYIVNVGKLNKYCNILHLSTKSSNITNIKRGGSPSIFRQNSGGVQKLARSAVTIWLIPIVPSLRGQSSGHS